MKSKFEITLLVGTSRKCGRGILRGVAHYSRLHGPWNISRIPPYYRTPTGRKKFVNLKEIQSDGVIFMETESPEKILPTGLPAIAIDVKHQIYGISNVVTNCKEIGEMAAKHFLERGFKHFAFCGFDDIHWSRERHHWFVNYLEKSNYKVHLYKQPLSRTGKNLSWDKEKNHMTQWLKSLPYPVAILTCNDDRGDNILEACKDGQLKVPYQIAVLGVDNDALICEISDPPLSSIEMNFEKAGFEAAHVLDRWMKGENMADERIAIQSSRVVVRQSTDILAIDDRDVANAIRFINEHVHESIQVGDIADSVFVSRRMLEKRFKIATGFSIGSQLRKARTNHIAQLLLETSMSITEIGLSMGFTSTANFSRYFQKEFNMKPSQYRKQ